MDRAKFILTYSASGNSISKLLTLPGEISSRVGPNIRFSGYPASDPVFMKGRMQFSISDTLTLPGEISSRVGPNIRF